ncbi:DUF885 domain-containing protein [Luteipulveratus sp. YIM 133132]|uniref:DUF885 domain-containing protein n=1 Tax=Luteipulveratus flavus TaxID=3031728 RepID=UPI0023B0E1FB|nr:DUF885 domain-containing protein [Luteipulveratus sp. YIM 133132]MDE9367016.1 DUF885 domain-containing protein [Luteipulveratus sp. YIM 133132]
MTDTTTTRTPTAVDAIADRYHEAALALSPIGQTYLGIPGHETELDDFSPAGHEAHATLRAGVLRDLDAAEPVDDVDRVTISAMRDRLGLAQETHEAGIDIADLNVIASPLQEMRDVLDLMPTDTDEHWSHIAGRLRAMPAALDQWFESLHAAADRGLVSARRQVEACIKQTLDHTADDGYFATLVSGARIDGDDLGESVREDLESAAREAAAAYRAAGDRLRSEVLPKAPEADGCGREIYPLHSRRFLGAAVDLEETYAWGQEELARITEEMQRVAEQIKPGASVKEAMQALDADAAYELHGTDALKAWMQEKADEAIAELGGTHFDIPVPVQTIECMIAPTQSGGIYYTGPSEDFSRPGRMWWSVPKGVEQFGTWRELTTVYHEGVPGHHLQVAQTMYRSELLNSWRRMDAWTSGHGEGWALYAERLMDELGYLDDPGSRLGMLDGQSLRAARVVLDIGVHCGFEAPAEVGGGSWTYDKAWQFLNAHADMAEGFLRFELDRYLGWPGQAPSYKIGERLWMQLRQELQQREGDAFDLKAFHRRALDIGGVGLDTLREALLRPTS